jgi:hypothetical protein
MFRENKAKTYSNIYNYICKSSLHIIYQKSKLSLSQAINSYLGSTSFDLVIVFLFPLLAQSCTKGRARITCDRFFTKYLPFPSTEQLRTKTNKITWAVRCQYCKLCMCVGQGGIAATASSFISGKYEKRKNHG